MDTGSLPEWLGALVACAALAASFATYQVSLRMLAVEQRRDQEAEDRKHRSEASRFLVVGAKAIDRDASRTWSIYMNNFSTEPIYDVRIESQLLNGDHQNHPLTLACVPPGQWLVPSDPKYHWGSPISLEAAPEPFELLTKTARPMITRVEYVDLIGVNWKIEMGERIPIRM